MICTLGGLVLNTDKLDSLGYNDESKEETKDQLLERIKILKEHLAESVQINKDLRKTKSVEVRTGTFEKQITRHGKKKKESLTRFQRNPAKLSIGYLGNLEIFCYPYSSFDKFYIRDRAMIHGYDRYDTPRLMAVYNKLRWVQENGKRFIKGNMDSESSLATEILNAYNAGIAQDMIKINALAKDERKAMIERLVQMKPEFRKGFLEDDLELKKLYNRHIRKQSKSKG